MVKLLKTSVTWTAPPTLKRSVEVPLKTAFTGQWVSGKVPSVRKRVKSGLAEDGNAAIRKRGNALQLVNVLLFVHRTQSWMFLGADDTDRPCRVKQFYDNTCLCFRMLPTG